MKFKTGDKVLLSLAKIAGKKENNKNLKENKVIVENVNIVKKHQKSDGRNPGGIIEMEAIMLLCYDFRS